MTGGIVIWLGSALGWALLTATGVTVGRVGQWERADSLAPSAGMATALMVGAVMVGAAGVWGMGAILFGGGWLTTYDPVVQASGLTLMGLVAGLCGSASFAHHIWPLAVWGILLPDALAQFWVPAGCGRPAGKRCRRRCGPSFRYMLRGPNGYARPRNPSVWAVFARRSAGSVNVDPTGGIASWNSMVMDSGWPNWTGAIWSRF